MRTGRKKKGRQVLESQSSHLNVGLTNPTRRWYFFSYIICSSDANRNHMRLFSAIKQAAFMIASSAPLIVWFAHEKHMPNFFNVIVYNLASLSFLEFSFSLSSDPTLKLSIPCCVSETTSILP